MVFELTENGLYKRKEIAIKVRNPKFGNLRDVDIGEFKENINYLLRNVDKKWTLVPYVIIDWLVKFEFISPYTLVAKNNTIRKAINAGPLIISLVSVLQSKGNIVVKPFKKNKFLGHKKDNVGELDTIEDFNPKMNISDSFAMVFDFIIKPSDKSISTVIMPGITFSWRNIGSDELSVFVVIHKYDNDVNVSVSNDNLNILVNKQLLTRLDQIKITHLNLIGFILLIKLSQKMN